MSKIIKKIAKVFSYLILLTFLLPVVVWLLLQIPAVQNMAVSRTLTHLSGLVGTKIEYSEVRVTYFNRIRFNDLFIADQQNDTLLYAKRTVGVMPVLLTVLAEENPNRPILKKLKLEEANIKLQKDSTDEINLRFIIDYIKENRDTAKIKKPVRIKEIELTDSRFFLRTLGEAPDKKGINFRDLQISDLDLKTSDLIFYADTVQMHIDKLSLNEPSGFQLEEFSGDLQLCNSYMHYSDLTIQTANSTIKAEFVNMDFDQYNSFQTETLFDAVQFNINFEESTLNTADLGYFTDFFWEVDQDLQLDGKFYGPLSNLKGENFSLGWGYSSYFLGDFDMNGLPDAESTFLIFDLEELVTNNRDIESLNLPRGKKFTLPEAFSKLSNFRYKGNFTGFFTDFVAYGKFSTNLGEVSTDIMFSPDSANRISFTGRVETDNFRVGKLFSDDEFVGDISLDAGIDGILTKDGPVSAKIQGDISRLVVREYPYQNLSIDGDISNKRFKGALTVDDPNLIMQFDGLIDLKAVPRQYDFTANIIDAHLTNLNLSKVDPNYHASFLIQAKAEGQSIDELNGEIKLLNSLFTKSNKQIQMYGTEMTILNGAKSNSITIKSDVLDAKISGQYKLTSLKDNFIHYFTRFIPSLVDENLYDAELLSKQTQVDFDVTFKRTEPFFDFFFPDFLVSEETHARGAFITADQGVFKLDMFAPKVKIQHNSWKGLMMNVWTSDSLIHASMGSEVFNFNERIDLENFTLETQTYSNETYFTTRWLNWDSALYKGAVAGKAEFYERKPRLALRMEIDSSELTIHDTVWHMNEAMLKIDSTGILVDSLELRHKNQLLLANGKLSDIPGDSLDFEFHEFDLANLNFFTRKKDFEFRGELNGNSRLTGIKSNPLFFSTLDISDLYINGEELGNCFVNSIWDNKKQSLNVRAKATRGDLAIVELSGDYFPARNGKMDFSITMDKLRINVFNPFLSGVFSDMQGLASGELFLAGFRGKPSLSGNIELQKNILTVDYLKTRYNFTTNVEVVNNNFILDNIELFDGEGNRAMLNGMIHTEYLKDLNLSLVIDARQLQCLNTREYDNNSFYGTAYATGMIRIKGPPSELTFNIDARTDKNTKFYIPLSDDDELSEFSYIDFIRRDTSDYSIPVEVEEYKVDLSGIQMTFNLDVTPDAEVQIIFDSKMGDIIKAEGNGMMHMSVNTLGSFQLLGEYVISKGEYLFTMQDVINKRLKIQEGSLLRWTGDPLNARVDITAVYRTRASLSDLYGDTEATMQSGKVTVDCKIHLEDQLTQPTVDYSIEMPFAEEDTRARVESKIGSEEELTKQFLSLMVLNRFMPNQSPTRGSNIAGVNASELLSNQLSNWLSQISSEVDVGVNYRPGSSNDFSDNEVEVALSTQLLNDRLTINGSVGTNAETQNSNNYMGDIDLDYKLTQNGKWRARTFFRTTDDQITTSSKYVTGVGMFYMEEFNSVKDLFGKKKKKKDAEEDHKEDEAIKEEDED